MTNAGRPYATAAFSADGAEEVKYVDSDTSPNAPRERYRVQSVDRALTLLEILAEVRPEGVALSEASRRLGTSKSTTLSLLRTLASHGLVAIRDDGDGPRYRLGLALARLGDQVLAQTGLLDVALPVLRELTELTERTSRVAVLDDGYVVAIGHVPGPGFIQVQSHLGRRELPHCSALGKSILSQLPLEEVRAIVRRAGLPSRTERTITDFDDLVAELELTRRRGYAVDDEEDSVGVLCVGAPILDHRDTCVGAISITGVRLSTGPAGLADLAEHVQAHAARLSRQLGRDVRA